METDNIHERSVTSDEKQVETESFKENMVESGYSPDEPWDTVPETSRWERWAYYLYYNGNNGVNNYSYVPVVIQSLAETYGWDPSDPTRQTACDPSNVNAQCVVGFGAGPINVSSMVLVSNALSFALQAIILTSIGSLADFGNNGRWYLLFFTLLSIAAQIAFLAFTEPWQWWIAMLVGLVVYITYGITLVFYEAIFPKLAVNDPRIRQARREKDPDYTQKESWMRNTYSTISTAWSNIGFVMISAILLGLYQGFSPNNLYSNNVASAVCGGFWLVNAIPWFFLEKNRPGPKLPEGARYLTYGWKQVGLALKECRKLSQTFMFLLGYFVLSDAINTTGQVVAVIQNNVVSYQGSILTLFGLIQGITSIIGCLGFLYIQRYFKLTTKQMLQFCNVMTLIIPLWGCIGISPNVNLGFKTVSEFWAYNVWFGLFTSPYYAYTQTMMSELIPAGQDYMFFALFGIANKVSSFIGPTIIAAVIQATNYQWYSFPICLFLQLVPVILIWTVSMPKAKREIYAYECNTLGLHQLPVAFGGEDSNAEGVSAQEDVAEGAKKTL